MMWELYPEAEGPYDGCDSMIVAPPTALFGTPGRTVMHVNFAVKFLRELSIEGAKGCGRELHHATWELTDDPAIVEKVGMIHGCLRCRAATDQALAFLAAEPDRELLVGVLYFLP